MEKKGAITLKNINKYYGKNHVLKDLDFEIRPGEFLSLLGPSGCGKTTILRLIAGLEHLDSGEIYMDEDRIDRLEPYKRNLNTVFQNYALFPHMDVYKNIAYGLKAKWLSHKEIDRRVKEVISMVRLEGFEKRQPSQMSGGQKQRVSIARAIVNQAPVLLLDEPLTALDLKLRKEMRFELRRLQKQLGITFIFVTHDQEEAIVMSDRIAVMNGGKIEQVGTPEEIYSHPASQFVAEFIGETNVFEAVASVDGSELRLKMESGTASALNLKDVSDNEFVNCSVRPDAIRLSETPVEGFNIPGIVSECIFSGSFEKAIIRLVNDKEIKYTRLSGSEIPKPGTKVYVYWDKCDAEIMKTEGYIVHSQIEEVDLSAWNN